jgi:hypothetical protein
MSDKLKRGHSCVIQPSDTIEASAYEMLGTGQKTVSIEIRPVGAVVTLTPADALVFAGELLNLAASALAPESAC